MMNLLAENPLNHIVPHALGHEGWLSHIDNHMLMTAVAAVLLILLIPRAVKCKATGNAVEDLTPRGAGNFFESICAYLRTEVARPALGAYTDRFIPYIWTAFFFVLFCNLLGLVPLDAFFALFGWRVHLGGTPTGNIYVTATLALCTLFMILFNGLRYNGVQYLAHFCPGPLWLAPLLVPVEIVGLCAKIFALAMRLFANMIAGHILLAVLVGFVGAMGSLVGRVAIGVPVVLGSVAITLLELFVAFLQAFIFTFLTTLFIGQSVVLHHGEEHAAGAHGH